VAYKKISISLPEQLIEDARQFAGKGGVSSFIAETLEAEMRRRYLREAVSGWEQEFGAITTEERKWARDWWDKNIG